MTELILSINYRLREGQRLYLTGSLPETGGGDPAKALQLKPLDGDGDTLSIRIKAKITSPTRFTYRYFIDSDQQETFCEAGEPRLLELSPQTSKAIFHDCWQGNSEDAPLLTAPFAHTYFSHGAEDTPVALHAYPEEIIIRVTVPAVGQDEKISLCGDASALGRWNPSAAVRMTPVSGSRWEAHFAAGKLPRAVTFKFIKTSGKNVEWEDGENRTIDIPPVAKHSTLSFEYASTAFPLPRPRFFGTAIPVFSLRSEKSCGIGSFTDLKPLCDWAARTGQSIIQLLPINDTTASGTWTDSYPYSPISVIALHPIYLDVLELGKVADKSLAAELEKERKRLDALPAVDYEGVSRLKKRYISALYDQTAERIFASADYKKFYEENAGWLPSYAAFCALRDHFGTADHTAWGEYAAYTPDIPKTLYNNKKSFARRPMSVSYFIQYHLHRQLTDAVNYAHQHGIVLKGDIPIGITLNSVGTWCFPELFHTDSQTGAPPDFFSADGQNWGFPTYNWEEMAKDHYLWWKTRLRKMAQFFDAYRIDHVLGFFRIWEIPRPQVSGKFGHFSPALPYTKAELNTIPNIDADRLIKKRLLIPDPRVRGRYHPVIAPQSVSGFDTLSQPEKDALLGLHYDFFFRRHNEYWRINAYRKLPELISATAMLTCAEDLGMIPDCVPEVMSSLKILSLQIFRMPKSGFGRFDDPAHYPYLSVCTTGSHDTTTIRGWWEEDRSAAEDYYHNVLHGWGECPAVCEQWICEEIIRRHAGSTSMLTILPLQDWLSIDDTLRAPDAASERINDPANPHHYWRYRMHLTLERLCSEDTFNKKLKSIINR